MLPVVGGGLLVAIMGTAAWVSGSLGCVPKGAVRGRLLEGLSGIGVFVATACLVTALDGANLRSPGALTVIGVSALCEELVFRCLLPSAVFSELAKATGLPAPSAIASVLGTQACFALSHGWASTWSAPDPLTTAALTGSGLALFTVARLSGLHPAVAVHAFLNWSAMTRFPEQGRFREPSTVVPWVALSVVVACATAAVVALRSPNQNHGGLT